MSCKCWQVNVDNIDRDLFGRAVKGAMYQPSDETSHDMRMAAHNLMLSAYEDNLVSSCPGRTRALPLCGDFRTGTSGMSFAQKRHPACTGHLMHQGVRKRERDYIIPAANSRQFRCPTTFPNQCFPLKVGRADKDQCTTR